MASQMENWEAVKTTQSLFPIFHFLNKNKPEKMIKETPRGFFGPLDFRIRTWHHAHDMLSSFEIATSIKAVFVGPITNHSSSLVFSLSNDIAVSVISYDIR